jgi:hypothetical protein
VIIINKVNADLHLQLHFHFGSAHQYFELIFKDIYFWVTPKSPLGVSGGGSRILLKIQLLLL